MTPSTVMIQAKQGDSTAIATLLNRSLQSRGITATVRRAGPSLTIELTSPHPITQTAAIAFFQQGMHRLQPQGIRSVLVCAQTDKTHDFAWIETFELEGAVPSSAPPAEEAISSPPGQAAPEPIQPVPSTPARSSPAQSRSAPQRRSLPPSPNRTNRQAGISSQGVEALIIGLVAAIVLFQVGFLRLLLNGAVILVHEVGHAVTHWAFGRPAIPTVNLVFGGGITLTFGQVWLLNVLIYLGIGYLIYCLRNYPKLQGITVLLALLYTYCLFTPINQMLSVAMGHGLELVAIALCLYLSGSGKLCRIPGDRAIYAMLGFFILFSSTNFYWNLLHDPDFREWYEGGIGGMIDNDLVILATEYFQVDLSRVASGFLAACVVTPAIGLGACLMRSPFKHLMD